ncbi:MAG TPA: carbohydrate-binding family 9-like protein [Candidatus Acidoferrales bacterium]|nr:carbohydrate-binding family 9-like protein [Candidatus Acidoferrales bacterium]
MKKFTNIVVILMVSGTAYPQIPQGQKIFPVPQIPFSPKEYVCYHTAGSIDVDGKLDEESWKNAAWTEYFVDIQGSSKPAPLYQTRLKMLWDDRYLYIGAEIQEPNLWATLRQRDTVIFRDNDFEVFIDPNGATQPYYETEVNALGTVWDLLLREPYRDVDRAAVNAWDIKGLKIGVVFHGTLNNPSDVDTGWTVELAFPWSVLGECAIGSAPPKEGSQWRINFSRVEWRSEVENGAYVKETDPVSGETLPEYNWVWSPQGLINMHYPEMWGFVQFSTQTAGQGIEQFKWNPVEDAKWALRKIYYAEKEYFLNHGVFADEISNLNVKVDSLKGYSSQMKIFTTPSLFEAILTSDDGNMLVHINQDGKTWETKAR